MSWNSQDVAVDKYKDEIENLRSQLQDALHRNDELEVFALFNRRLFFMFKYIYFYLVACFDLELFVFGGL